MNKSMVIVQGIIKNEYEKSGKATGYISVDDVRYEINEENLRKVASIVKDAQTKGIKIENRRLWVNENLNPLNA